MKILDEKNIISEIKDSVNTLGIILKTKPDKYITKNKSIDQYPSWT